MVGQTAHTVQCTCKPCRATNYHANAHSFIIISTHPIHPSQPCHHIGSTDRPLRLLDDPTVLDLLWNGPCSLSKRLLTAAAGALAENRVKIAVDGIMSAMVKDVTTGTAATLHDRLQTLWALVAAEGVSYPPLARVAAVVNTEAASVEDARVRIKALAGLLRELAEECARNNKALAAASHTAAGDILLMYAHTTTWFTAGKYKSTGHGVVWGVRVLLQHAAAHRSVFC